MRSSRDDTQYPVVKVFAQDESRFGLLTVRRRRLMARGVQPVGTVQHTFHSFYLYGAVAPTTGDHLFFSFPRLNSTTFQIFLDAFAQTYPDSLNILVLDTSGAHTAKRLTIPPNIRFVLLPPSTPELNPIERLWRDVKDKLAWKPFTDVNAQQHYVAALLGTYDAQTLQSLTAYSYVVDAVNALSA